MKHVPVDMGIRSIKCSCGCMITISPAEAAGKRAEQVNDMLLDRLATHKAAMKQQGR